MTMFIHEKYAKNRLTHYGVKGFMKYACVCLCWLFMQMITVSQAHAWLENSWTKQLKGTHVQGVIDQWGQPASAKKQLFSSSINYSWKYCEKTGVIQTQCNYGNCQSWPEYSCCYQSFVTDKNGIIQKYKENASNKNSVCIDLDLQAVTSNRVNMQNNAPRDFFGSFYIVNRKTRDIHWAGGYTDKNKLHAELSLDCDGQCVESFPFKNTCAAVADVGDTRNYYYASNPDPKVATATALQDCKNQHGENAGCHVLGFTVNQVSRPYVCADVGKLK